MTTAALESRIPKPESRVFYGWIVLGVAALAMVGTLPGRTQGLGLITEPLLRDLGVTRVAYAQINLVATLVGALFCAGIGPRIDRQRRPESEGRAGASHALAVAVAILAAAAALVRMPER